MSVKEILEHYNMSMADLCRRFKIPYRTVQDWKQSRRHCPEYILAMMVEILENDANK